MGGVSRFPPAWRRSAPSIRPQNRAGRALDRHGAGPTHRLRGISIIPQRRSRHLIPHRFRVLHTLALPLAFLARSAFPLGGSAQEAPGAPPVVPLSAGSSTFARRTAGRYRRGRADEPDGTARGRGARCDRRQPACSIHAVQHRDGARAVQVARAGGVCRGREAIRTTQPDRAAPYPERRAGSLTASRSAPPLRSRRRHESQACSAAS